MQVFNTISAVVVTIMLVAFVLPMSALVLGMPMVLLISTYPGWADGLAPHRGTAPAVTAPLDNAA